MENINPMQKYLKLQKIAEGSYGSVYKVRNKLTNELCALKKFKDISKEGIPVSAMREIKIMNLLKGIKGNERVLQLIEVMEKEGSTLMAIQWMDHTLSQLIQQKQPYDPKILMWSILSSLRVMHQNFIMHRDLKPSNIMLRKIQDSSSLTLKIVDFGMAKQDSFDEALLTNEVGSLYYRAPELLLATRRYSYSIDMWSVGCVFYELLTRKIMFKSTNNNELEQVTEIFKVLGQPDSIQHPQISNLFNNHFDTEITKGLQQSWTEKLNQMTQPNDQAIHLLKSLLKLQPSQRLNVEQAMKHQYFDSLSI